MARPKAATESESPLSRRVLVLISRDQTTKTPRVVWAHEKPVLEAVFGEGTIDDVDPATLDEGFSAKVSADLMPYNKQQDPPRRPSESAGLGFVFIGDKRAEYERMVRCYGSDEKGSPWVEAIYGRFSSNVFSNLLGRPSLDDLPAAQLRQVIRAHGYSLPIVTYESTDAERAAAVKDRAAFDALDVPALVKLAEEIGVEIGG